MKLVFLYISSIILCFLIGLYVHKINWENIFRIIEVVGVVTVPIVIYWLANKYQNKEKKEQKKEKDREYIRAFIKEELKPFIPNVYEFDKKITDKEAYKKEIKEVLDLCGNNLLLLKNQIRHLSYAYMEEYFNLLEDFTKIIAEHRNLTTEDLKKYFIGFYVAIRFIDYYLLLDKNQCKIELLAVANAFIQFEGTIRDITLELLEKKYPRYHKSAIKFIDYIKQNPI